MPLWPLLPIGTALAYWALSAWLLRRWIARPPISAPTSTSAGDELPPVVFFRPIKRGVPRLEDKIRTLLLSTRPGDRVLFGVNSAGDAAICRAICRNDTPEGVESLVLSCPPPSPSNNPKVQKLIAMTAQADALAKDAPEHWIITDAEALTDRATLDAFRTEWQASSHAALTTGYRFTSPDDWPELLDRLPLILTLWPGLIVSALGTTAHGAGPKAEFQSKSRSESRRGLGFALGACMAVRRSALLEIGGWERLLPYLAEDNRLGAFLAQQGHTTGLSRQIVTLAGDPLDWRSAFQHLHRIAVTYRVCNPWGTLGMIFTHGVTWAALFAALHPTAPVAWIILAVVALVRIRTARQISRPLDCFTRVRPLRFATGVLLSSFLESALWLIAWLPLPITWGGRQLRVDRRGRLITARETPSNVRS